MTWRNNIWGVTLAMILSAVALNAHAKELPADAESIRPIMPGMEIPACTVRTVGGEEVDLKQIVSQKPTVLLFYRGGWCPYCNAHLGQIRDIEDTLVDLGYQILAVSADSPAVLSQAEHQEDAAYQLLSDSRLTAAQAFGIAFHVSDDIYEKYIGYGINLEERSGETHHALPVPAAFVVGTDGLVKFSYVNPNYKERVDPDVLIAAAKAALKKKALR